MWPFLNNVTTTCEQNYCTPASSICYTGPNLSCIGVNKNDTLSVALQKINTLMCEPITNAEIIEALGYIPANDENLVHKTGNEFIQGIKSFDSDLIVNGINVGRGGGNEGTNVAIGQSTLFSNTTGSSNTASGTSALQNNTTGSSNTASGTSALQSNTTSSSNTANGSYALQNNTTGSSNTASGTSALQSNTTGNNNTAIGSNALVINTSGSNNTAIGQSAGKVIGDKITLATILNNSIILGFNASPLANNQTNQIVIGYNAIGLGSNTTVIGNSSTTVTGLYGNIRLVSGMAIAPASATASGTLGDIVVTNTHIYVCSATNTWVRTALTTWV